MKTRYIYRILLLAITFMAGACTNDEFNDLTSDTTDGNVEVKISLADLVNNDMNSRAADADILSVVNDLNIRINFKDNSAPLFKYITTSTKPSENVIKQLDNKGNSYLHFKLDKEVSSVEVIGNYNSAIKSPTDWTKAMTSSPSPQSQDWSTSFKNNTCILYGKTENSSGNGTGGHSNCKLYNIALKRPYAMIKLNIETSKLYNIKDNDPKTDNRIITIKPLSAELYNVPKDFTFDVTNSPKDIKDIDRKGQAYTFPDGIYLNGDLNGIPNPNEYQNNVSANHLYMYENIPLDKYIKNCKSASSFDQKYKTPNIFTSNDDKGKADEVYQAFINPSANGNGGGMCSYILLKAEYTYKYNNGNKAVKGLINYRFFLGENIQWGFNVQRNTIYNLTLQLSGLGGIKEAGIADNNEIINVSGNAVTGAQWRVDTNLETSFIDFETTNFNIDGILFQAPLYYDTKELGDKVTWKISVSDKFTSPIQIFYYSGGYPQWATPDPKETPIVTTGGKGEIYFFITACSNDWKTNWNQKDPFRAMDITIQPSNDPQNKYKKTYNLKQWYPIKIKNGLWVDRIDRSPSEGLPWGEDQFLASKTNTQTIMREYRDKCYIPSLSPLDKVYTDPEKMQLVHEISNKNVMNNTIHKALNTSGSSSLSEIQYYSNGYYSPKDLYHYSLPTVEEWVTIDNYLKKNQSVDDGTPIEDNNYNQLVDYWTISHTKKNQASVFNPTTLKGESRLRSERHRFRLIYRE